MGTDFILWLQPPVNNFFTFQFFLWLGKKIKHKIHHSFSKGNLACMFAIIGILLKLHKGQVVTSTGWPHKNKHDYSNKSQQNFHLLNCIHNIIDLP